MPAARVSPDCVDPIASLRAVTGLVHAIVEYEHRHAAGLAVVGAAIGRLPTPMRLRKTQ